MNRIKDLRTELNKPLIEVASAVEISAPSLMRYEKGTTEPKLATWRKLLEYFDVSFEYLVGWTDERRRDGKY